MVELMWGVMIQNGHFGGAILVSLTQSRKVSTFPHFLDFRESTGQFIQSGWDCLSGKGGSVPVQPASEGYEYVWNFEML